LYGHKCRHIANPLKQEKEVDEELFHARPPFGGRSVVVQGKVVLTLLPLLNVGALRATIVPYFPSHLQPIGSPISVPSLGSPVTSPGVQLDAGFQIHHNPTLPAP